MWLPKSIRSRQTGNIKWRAQQGGIDAKRQEKSYKSMGLVNWVSRKFSCPGLFPVLGISGDALFGRIFIFQTIFLFSLQLASGSHSSSRHNLCVRSILSCKRPIVRRLKRSRCVDALHAHDAWLFRVWLFVAIFLFSSSFLSFSLNAITIQPYPSSHRRCLT